MRNLFYRRGHNGRLSLSTIPATRWERWRADFEEGRGPLFYAVALLAAAGFYAFVWLALALFVAMLLRRIRLPASRPVLKHWRYFPWLYPETRAPPRLSAFFL